MTKFKDCSCGWHVLTGQMKNYGWSGPSFSKVLCRPKLNSFKSQIQHVLNTNRLLKHTQTHTQQIR